MTTHHDPHKPVAKHAAPAPFTSDELKAICEQWLPALCGLSMFVGDNNTQHLIAIVTMLAERDDVRDKFVKALGGK